MESEAIAAIVFDVFGTVVDWRTGIVEAARKLAPPSGDSLGAFADDWRREGYLIRIAEVVSGGRPFAPVEALLTEPLPELLERHRVDVGSADRQTLLSAWGRLDPWPDVVDGLDRLRRRYLVAPLSNASFAQLTGMAKRAGLRWDCIISSELFATYKPDPATYLGAARLLGLDPGTMMLVAAHPADLQGAMAAGLRTAFVPRPEEWGPEGRAPEPPDEVDVIAADFGALAQMLGA